MSLLKHLHVEKTYNHRPTPEVTLITQESGNLRGGGFATQTEYVAQLSVKVNFWANTAEYRNALRAAERHLLHTIYGDALARIDEVLYHISNDDKQSAREALKDFRSELLRD